jgi:hypothetical protein
MKKIFRKSFVLALIALPLLSHAKICAGGKVNGIAVRGDGNLSFELQIAPGFGSPDGLWEDNIMWTSLTGDRLTAVRTQLTAALHSGNFVRTYSDLNDCVKITSVVVCPTTSSCKIANYSW